MENEGTKGFQVIGGKLFGSPLNISKEMKIHLKTVTKEQLLRDLKTAEADFHEKIERARHYQDDALKAATVKYMVLKSGFEDTIRSLRSELEKAKAEIEPLREHAVGLEHRVYTLRRQLEEASNTASRTAYEHEDALVAERGRTLRAKRQLAHASLPFAQRMFGPNFHLNLSDRTTYTNVAIPLEFHI